MVKYQERTKNYTQVKINKFQLPLLCCTVYRMSGWEGERQQRWHASTELQRAPKAAKLLSHYSHSCNRKESEREGERRRERALFKYAYNSSAHTHTYTRTQPRKGRVRMAKEVTTKRIRENCRLRISRAANLTALITKPQSGKRGKEAGGKERGCR